jgi:hypothetical protein
LDAGNNVLAIDNAYIAGAITITAGSGADFVTLGEFSPVSPRNNLSINTAGGDDIVRLGVTRYTVFLAANGSVNLGEGNNQAALYGASSVRDTSIAAGSGNDSIYVFGFNASDGGLSLLGDAGNNSLAVIASLGRFGIFLRGWEGTNSFYVQDSYAITGLTIMGNSGAPNAPASSSVITVSGCRLPSAQIVGTPGPDDMMIVSNSVIDAAPQASLRNTMMVSGNGGDDDIQLHYNFIFEDLFARMGDGNDLLWLNTNNIRGRAELDGEAGTNTLRLSGNLIGTLVTNNFTQA